MNRIRRIFILFFILFFVLLSGSLASFFFFSKGGNGIVVGGKDTEGHVLGEIMAQLIEESLSLPVRRQYNLEGTLIHFQAIQACQIDLYIEYSGTAALTIFQGRIEGKSRRAHTQNLQKAFLEEFGLVYLPALGFQNTYALMMEERVAKEKGIETLSDFAAKLKEGETFSIAFDAEFYGRAERQALEEGYQIDLRGFPLMDHTLLYLTLKKGGVEVINGYSTDGLCLGLKQLIDDKEKLPFYDAAPLVRQEVLKKFPGLEEVLVRLSGLITEEMMQEMNDAVVKKGENLYTVARKFLLANHLIAS